jgi:hypothetical protein
VSTRLGGMLGGGEEERWEGGRRVSIYAASQCQQHAVVKHLLRIPWASAGWRKLNRVTRCDLVRATKRQGWQAFVKLTVVVLVCLHRYWVSKSERKGANPLSVSG